MTARTIPVETFNYFVFGSTGDLSLRKASARPLSARQSWADHRRQPHRRVSPPDGHGGVPGER